MHMRRELQPGIEEYFENERLWSDGTYVHGRCWLGAYNRNRNQITNGGSKDSQIGDELVEGEGENARP